MLRRRSESHRAEVEARIRDAIRALVPMLRLEASAIELVEYRDGTATLSVHGGCPECEMSVTTFLQGIEAHLRLRVPEVRHVRCVSEARERNG